LKVLKLDKDEIALYTTAHTHRERSIALEKFERHRNYGKIDRPLKHPSSDPRYFLGNSGACATGITVTKGKIITIMEPLWSWADEFQVLGRIHRITQTMPTYSERLHTPDLSVEDRLIQKHIYKSAMRNSQGQTKQQQEEERLRGRQAEKK
jgi:SNF2 family DNA or RNA helicase